jgi:hypothetical protein
LIGGEGHRGELHSTYRDIPESKTKNSPNSATGYSQGGHEGVVALFVDSASERARLTLGLKL